MMSDNKKGLLSAATETQAKRNETGVNLHRILRDCKPGSAWRKIYYDPLLTGGYSGNFPTFDEKDPLFTSSPDDFFLREFENISIDKIVLLFGAPSVGADGSKYFWRNFETMIEFGLSEFMSSTPLYKRCCKWFSDFYISWQCQQNNSETIRIEFNPNKTDISKLEVFFSALKPQALKLARVTRLDVAIDYARYINPLCWLVRNTPYSARFEYASELKTRYFGAPSSDVQLRIYDKAFEVASRCPGNDLACDFWRVEAQIKAIKGETFFFLDRKTVCGFNPFDRLEYYDAHGFNHEGQGAYSLFVECCRLRDVAWSVAQVDFKTRKTYLSKLKSDMLKLNFNLPNVIYSNVFDSVYNNFVRRLQAMFDSGQAKGKAVFL